MNSVFAFFYPLLICILLCQAADGEEPQILLNQVIKNNPGAIREECRQVILVSNSTPKAISVDIVPFENVGGEWRMKFGKMPGSGAKNGFAPYDKKTEGDDRVPTGIFKIGTTFGYERKIRTRMPYKQATDLDFWIDDSNSEKYNTWVRIPHKGDVPRDSAGRIISHERMKRRDHLYHYGFVVDYNTDPVVRGKGSAIFFHWELTAGAPTFGCIATSRDNLVAILKWLDPDKMPVVVLGTQSDLKSNRIH